MHASHYRGCRAMVKPLFRSSRNGNDIGYSAGNVVGLRISSASPDRNEKPFRSKTSDFALGLNRAMRLTPFNHRVLRRNCRSTVSLRRDERSENSTSPFAVSREKSGCSKAGLRVPFDPASVPTVKHRGGCHNTWKIDMNQRRHLARKSTATRPCAAPEFRAIPI